MATYEPAPEPVPGPAVNPVSPKTKWAALLALAVPLLLTLLGYIINAALQLHVFATLPQWAEGLITGVLGAVVVAIGSYKARDPLRAAELARRGVPADQR